MDWLHAVDLGITADWLGSLFFYLQSEKIRGVSKLLRCAKLFTDIQEYYNRVQATDRLPKLLPTMLRDEDKGKAKAPKLRAKAGEARALVPCALELARKYLDPVVSQEEAMLHAAEALNSMYTCLSSAAWDQAVFRDATQRYLLLAGQLGAFFEEDKIFRVKPKAHQLVELARHDVNPSKI